ncbi:PREDICTED: uncharacterized protein LOC109224260 [Nicotiana attenuata]|uniref:uncharacterized protein LOC109224260 n=1 Tax=Nicotiana attenuata TaxID=49451 RepID=UPI0009054751|nr:PREDICTED: uncharacterized protein LOC109224260 [Nicotiana attenuata]
MAVIHPYPVFELIGQSKLNSVGQALKEKQLLNRILQDNLSKAQNQMKLYADSKRSERTFEEGDWVFLKLQPYRQSTVAVQKNLKLLAKFYGPYQIVRKIGKVAYELKLPQNSKIHPIFHVSQLKKKVGDKTFVAQDPPFCTEEGPIRIEPLAILDRRMVKKGNRAVTKVLVQWTNLSPEEVTREDYSFLKSQFPNFDP